MELEKSIESVIRHWGYEARIDSKRAKPATLTNHLFTSQSPTPHQTKMPPKQKQQIISRFFAPKPKPTDQPQQSPPPQSQTPSASSPKTSTTVSFSPAKRKLLSSHLSSKKPKPRKLLEPSPVIPSQNPQSIPKNYTPLEQQVLELKKKYPDVLLMIEVGYKFRFFGQDAEIAGKVLGIYAHVDHNFITASIPSFRLNVHVRRLVGAGFKVGVVKQTETAAIKANGENKTGPFCRNLSALYTKATVEAAEDVGGSEEGFCNQSNYLCCVVEKSDQSGDFESGFDVRIGFVAVEISTGDIVFDEFRDVFLRSGLEAMLLNLAPVELILGKPLSKQTEKLLLSYAGPASNVRVECASCDCFRDGGALAEVLSVYEGMSEEDLVDSGEQVVEANTKLGNHQMAIGEIMDMPDLVVQALALTIRHLKQFGFERILCLGASFRPFRSSIETSLSANTLQQLEILGNNSNGSEPGSLLHIMNHTLTIYGSRLLRHWVTHPLCDRNMISARLDAVSEIAESMMSFKASQIVTEMDQSDSDITTTRPDFYHLLYSVLTALGRSPDIQRGVTRIFHRTATASEFIAVIQAILSAGKKLQQLQIEEDQNYEVMGAPIVQSTLLKKLILTASSPSVVGNAAKLLSSLNKEAADKRDLPNLINTSNGQFPEVARAQKAVQFAKEKLDSLISLYRKQLARCNIEFLSVAGITHMIELPIDVKVPLNWVKVNSTKKTIRYHPPEVLTCLGQLSLENEKLMAACRDAWDSFLGGFGKYYAEFRAAVQALASLDCLHSLATLSKNENYNRPVFVDDNDPVQIHICSGRHPVLETILQDNFVPNNTNLHTSGEFCQIITGPNMGGKSCYIRQVALIAIMAQVGSFVPATSAKLHVLDGIYTRMGASDSIQQGRSTFLEELSEASHILRNCTPCSLVIIDELGRGTSTHDGGAIAYATLHHLLDQKKCMVLFVTHYPKIATDIRAEFPRSVGSYHVSYITSDKDVEAKDSYDNEDVTYLYKLVPGVSEKSFGFKVAQLAQIPSSCISCATVKAEKLEAMMSSRLRKRVDQKQLPAMLPTNQEQETQKDNAESPYCLHIGTISNAKELSDAYKQFFSNLKFATLDDNPAKALQFLKSAKTIVKELLARLG